MARRIEVFGRVGASADEVFAFLATPRNHRLLDTSGMIREAVHDDLITEVGQVFVMHMHNDIKGDHTVENHVVVFEPGQAIGWAPASPGDPPAGHLWIWRLESDKQGGCLVTHVYDWSRFTHLDMIDRLAIVQHDDLQQSIDLLANAVTR